MTAKHGPPLKKVISLDATFHSTGPNVKAALTLRCHLLAVTEISNFCSIEIFILFDINHFKIKQSGVKIFQKVFLQNTSLP
jgi:hypothetical protein